MTTQFFFLAVIIMMMIGVEAFDPAVRNITTTDTEASKIGFGGAGTGLIVGSMVAPVCCIVLVYNRLHWRWRLSGGFGYDDLAIVLALIFFIAQCVFASLSVFYGYGTEANFVDYDLIENALLFFYILQILYKATINCVKISILALYIRVFTPTWIRWVSMVLFIAAHLATLALVFVTMFQCVPVKCTYTPWDKPANSVSIDVAAFWKANALWNIGSDVLIIALPVSLIRGIRNLTVGQRINMLLMFGLGLVVLVAAILRFTTLGTAYNGHDDILTSSYVSTIWTQVESALAVSCACLPMLRPFLAWCLTPPGNVQSAATGGWVNMEEEVNSGLPRGAVMQPVPVERIGRAL